MRLLIHSGHTTCLSVSDVLVVATLDRALEILNGKRAWLQTKACNAPAMLHPLQAPTELVLKMKLLTNPRKGIPDASNN